MSEAMTNVMFVKIDVDECPDGKEFLIDWSFVWLIIVIRQHDISLFFSWFLFTCSLVAAKYNVSAMPTFIFIKSGEIIDRLMGANVDRLQEMIDEHK